MVSYDSLFDLDMRMSGVICGVDGLIINKIVNVQICFCEGAMIHFVHLQPTEEIMIIVKLNGCCRFEAERCYVFTDIVHAYGAYKLS